MSDFIRDCVALVSLGAFIGMVAIWSASLSGMA